MGHSCKPPRTIELGLNRVSLRTNPFPPILRGFRFIQTRGARDGHPTAYQSENRQKAEALRQVQRSGQLPIPLQEVPQGRQLNPVSRMGCNESRITTD